MIEFVIKFVKDLLNDEIKKLNLRIIELESKIARLEQIISIGY